MLSNVVTLFTIASQKFHVPIIYTNELSGEIIISDVVPEICPVCGAGSDQFVKLDDEVEDEKAHEEEQFATFSKKPKTPPMVPLVPKWCAF